MTYLYVLSWNYAGIKIEKVEILKETEKCYYLAPNKAYATRTNKIKLNDTNVHLGNFGFGIYNTEHKAYIALYEYLCSKINDKEDELNTLEIEKNKACEKISN